MNFHYAFFFNFRYAEFKSGPEAFAVWCHTCLCTSDKFVFLQVGLNSLFFLSEVWRDALSYRANISLAH